MILTQKKHLGYRVNVLRYCIIVIKRDIIYYLMEYVPIPGSKSSFEVLQLLDTWRFLSLVILFSVLL